MQAWACAHPALNRAMDQVKVGLDAKATLCLKSKHATGKTMTVTDTLTKD